VLLFLALPLAAMFLKTSPANLGNPQVIQAVSLSLFTTLITLSVTIIFGTPVTYLLARYQFPFQRAIDTLLDLPTILPSSVAGVALLMAFGRRGLVGEWLEIWGSILPFIEREENDRSPNQRWLA
jgi:molybdate transport system permease protein